MVETVGYECQGEDVVCNKKHVYYEASRSAVLLDSEKSSVFSVKQGVSQGCSFPCIY